MSHLNLSLPGAVLSRAIEDLARVDRSPDQLACRQLHRPPGAVRGPVDTTHLTIFAGGNDANTIAQAARAGRGGSDVNGVHRWSGAPVGHRLRGADSAQSAAARRTRGSSRSTCRTSPRRRTWPATRSTKRSMMQRIAVGLSDRVNALASLNVLVVDLMCDPRLSAGVQLLRRRLSSERRWLRGHGRSRLPGRVKRHRLDTVDELPAADVF